MAIGKKGQNVKLASQLLGSDIDVLTEEQEQERRSNENKVRSQRFMEALDVDEMIAHLLIAEGFSNVDEVALVDLNELSEIEGFDEEGNKIRVRAREDLAIAFQHEIDHLDGKLFIDYLSQFKRHRLLHHLEKRRRKECKAKTEE